METIKNKINNEKKARFLKMSGFLIIFFVIIYLLTFTNIFSREYKVAVSTNVEGADIPKVITPPVVVIPPLDKELYDKKLIEIANYKISTSTSATSTPNLWPPKTVYPNGGALLPFNRIIAYYGNFYAKGMGVLGQYPIPEMLTKLKAEVKKWEEADPNTPIIPAIDYIAVTAQGSAGKDGKYRARMPHDQIEKAIEVAKKVNGIVFLEIQPGLSDFQTEIPLLKDYLKLPEVHLALDPEFSMHNGIKPGRVIGTTDAADINFAINYLSDLVKENNITPKILVVHRFTEDMVTNYKKIKPTPEVQFVMDMDGWGFGAKKINTYKTVVNTEPVQFAGFKLFYKNDILPPSKRMLTNAEVLNLKPKPLYIQYQ